jgi:hypothetical protein
MAGKKLFIIGTERELAKLASIKKQIYRTYGAGAVVHQ